MKGSITMSIKETERIAVMDNLAAKKIKQKHAVKQLNLSVRQVQRMLKRYKREGVNGLVHKSRGRISNRAIKQEEKDRIIALIKQYYSDFGPTLAIEKLKEQHGVRFGVETLRKEMIKVNIWKPKKRKIENIHPCRERKSCVGELIQLDGSAHAWFKDQGNPCTLVAFIDDATSNIMDGVFVDYEGTWTLFGAVEHYLNTYGKPLALYVDKHSTFKINRQANIEEDLRDKQAQSQFTRAMDTLGIEVIFANSPQAKGRVERLFETLQDRLVKELRLKGISTKEKATKFFREVYIPVYNAKFAVCPKEKANLHKPLLFSDNLAEIFTIHSERIVSKDLIVQYKNTKYQLMPDNGYRYTLRKAAIRISEHKDGTITFNYKNIAVPYQIAIKAIHEDKIVQVVSSREFTERRVYIPPADHPWRQRFITA